MREACSKCLEKLINTPQTLLHWHAHVPRYYMYSSCAPNIRQLWCIHVTISSLESCTSVTQPNPIYPQIPVPAVFKVHVFFTKLHFLNVQILIITTVIHVPAQPHNVPCPCGPGGCISDTANLAEIQQKYLSNLTNLMNLTFIATQFRLSCLSAGRLKQPICQIRSVQGFQI